MHAPRLVLVDKNSGSSQRCNEVLADLLWIDMALRQRHQASHGLAVLFGRGVTVSQQRASSCIGVSHRVRPSWRLFKRHCADGGATGHLQDLLLECARQLWTPDVPGASALPFPDATGQLQGNVKMDL
jgi:hypothetical protein